WLSVKKAKLADIPVGSVAAVKLSVDQSTVMMLRAEGATVTGMLKGVDPDKGIVIITISRGRGEDPEEKSLTVSKDVGVFIDGVESTFANLKVGDNGPILQLRLSLDQKSVQVIHASEARRRE